ncbi:hypothetical protein CRI77_07935 [Mycolicibacterium duvalii]|uniref:LuxR family transcriptional regulator n=1 Tax=Mycolicibacterium duvalii TaxID=39688 RepID=A0A7I7K3F8_9MYCO|nr:LuxR family transcriptional regulator [Mycolicibacterium duvalii]MCV7367816.1 hypothetical protein [Mycolicibacterium duvalii]PEG42503.1 hypothetical protein CRI77_07935 [Mycolicibacterium duvalii]BBX18593.1 LuxR family transcriptional regulator [Mycolicibacterium duvalii]
MAGIAWRPDLTDTLRKGWQHACHGAGGTLVLLGDAGIGKSEAISWLAGFIGTPARLVVCQGGDLSAPMSAAAGIAQALGDDHAAARILGEIDPLQAAEALTGALVDRGSAGPGAVLIDDIHDADPASVTALNLALRRCAPGDVLVVVTGRPVPSAEAFAEGFPVHRLRGLDADGAATLLHQSSPVPIAGHVAERLLEVSGGNPLALTHLPASLSPQQLAGNQLLPEDFPLTGALHTVFTAQLARLSPESREVLELAAVSADGSWSLLTALRPGAGGRALTELEEAGLAGLDGGRLVLSHPLLRNATVNRMPRHRWRQLNLELADATSLPEEVRLAHRARGTTGPDDALVDEIAEASWQLRARGGAEAAARLLDRAVDITGDEARRGRLRVDAATLLAAAGEAGAARRRLQDVLDDPADTQPRTTAMLRMATLEALHGEPARAWQRLQEAAAGAAADEQGVVYATMALPLGMLGMVGEVGRSAEVAVARSRPGSPQQAVARVILAHAVSAQNEARANEIVETLHEAIDPAALIEVDPLVGLHLGRAFALAERYDAAATHLTALIAHSRRMGARASLAMAFGALGETQVRASRFDEAMDCLDESIALSLATGQRAFAPFWLSLRGRVHAIRGDDEAAAHDFRLGFDISDQQSTFGARYFLLANAGLAALLAGRHADAVTHLAECWSFEQISGLLAPQLARWHADLVEAYVALGRSEEAGAVVAHLREVAQTPGASRWTAATAWRAGAICTVARDPAAALDMFDRAIAGYDPETDLFDRARTLLDKAQLLESGPEFDRTLADAQYAVRRLGAGVWAARLTELSNPHLGPAVVDRLTDVERRVLDEVARGLTNQQIATRLHLSPKTVANHLYRVYRKLGVASRTEAARHVLLGAEPVG